MVKNESKESDVSGLARVGEIHGVSPRIIVFGTYRNPTVEVGWNAKDWPQKTAATTRMQESIRFEVLIIVVDFDGIEVLLNVYQVSTNISSIHCCSR